MRRIHTETHIISLARNACHQEHGVWPTKISNEHLTYGPLGKGHSGLAMLFDALVTNPLRVSIFNRYDHCATPYWRRSEAN